MNGSGDPLAIPEEEEGLPDLKTTVVSDYRVPCASLRDRMFTIYAGAPMVLQEQWDCI